MLPKGRYRWFIFVFVALVVATAGLVLGKRKEGDYLRSLYARTDFMLLTDDDEFFRLRDFPKTKLLLLVFTPDSLVPELVEPFRGFSRRVPDLQQRGVEVMLLTRGNREIARNFKNAAAFPAKLLIDNSGTVGKNLGIWKDLLPVRYWGYAVVDSGLNLYWSATSPGPLTFDEVWNQLQKLK